jgi:hexokinase
MVGAHAMMNSPNKASLSPNNLAPSSSPARRPDTSTRLLRAPTAFGLLVVLFALGVHFFAPNLSLSILRLLTQDPSSGITLRNPIVFQDTKPSICPKPVQRVDVNFVGTFNTKPERSMALAEQAKRVAAEFDFSKDAVNKAVQEFIREMGTHRSSKSRNQTLTTRR